MSVIKTAIEGKTCLLFTSTGLYVNQTEWGGSNNVLTTAEIGGRALVARIRKSELVTGRTETPSLLLWTSPKSLELQSPFIRGIITYFTELSCVCQLAL